MLSNNILGITLTASYLKNGEPQPTPSIHTSLEKYMTTARNTSQTQKRLAQTTYPTPPSNTCQKHSTPFYTYFSYNATNKNPSLNHGKPASRFYYTKKVTPYTSQTIDQSPWPTPFTNSLPTPSHPSSPRTE